MKHLKPNTKHENNSEFTHFERRVFGSKETSSYKLENGSGTYEKNYVNIMDDSSRIAMVRIGDQFPDDINDAITYILEVQIGSSVARSSKTGTVIDREEYYPFGDSSLRTFTKKRYRFTGKEKDLESGLYYYGARYYTAWSCRFISIDPKSAEQPNFTPYLYANNNPIRMNDPSGMQGEDAGDGSGGSATTDDTRIHNVVEGDKLSEIAAQYGISVEALRQANNLDPADDKTLQIGTKLRVPAAQNEMDEGSTPSYDWGSKDSSFASSVTSDNTYNTSAPLNPNTNMGNSDLDSWSTNFNTALTLTAQWVFEFGATDTTFNQDATANAFRNSRISNEARDYWYGKVNSGEKQITDSLTDFRGIMRIDGGNFGPTGYLKAGIDPIEQFVGSTHDYSIGSDGDSLTHVITNKSHLRSLLYGLTPESWNGHITSQTFIFKEAINQSRIK